MSFISTPRASEDGGRSDASSSEFNDGNSSRIPRKIPQSRSHDCLAHLFQGGDPSNLRRKPTISGALSQFDSSDLLTRRQQERGLAQIMVIKVKKETYGIFPDIAKTTTKGFEQIIEKKDLNECSLIEFIEFSLVDPDSFQYVTRDQRPPRESATIYDYATDAITGGDGIINRLKRNIMDEILMIIQSLITHNISDEVIAQLENYIDHILGQIVLPLKRAMFEILRSIAAERATGCCGCCKKLSKADKKNIARGICHMAGSVLGTVFGDGFERGANELASGICSLIAAESE
jgi:hypothetical protein